MNREKNILSLVALGLVGSVVGVAQAQPYLINISGATAQQNYFKAAASTNDFLDVDGDGVFSPSVDNLSPFKVAPPYAANHRWTVQYRAVGSGNGLNELVTWGQTFATNAADIPFSTAADGGFNNLTQYINAGATTGPANLSNPGAAPNTSTTTGVPSVLTSGGGIRIDIAPLDVPTLWFTRIAGAGAFDLAPGTAGYGTNAKVATDRNGAPVAQGNLLDTLGGLNTNLNNANTVYDTAVSLVPVAAVTNLGTGLTQITKTGLRYLTTTGRAQNGENLIVVTRDSGSGTRNAFMNGLGVDPSWGVGDNILASNSSTNDNAGPNYIPSNKGGSGRLEATVRNARLGVGYTGAERGKGNWLTGAQLEILAIRDDLSGGTDFVRPTASNVLNNGLRGQIDPSTGSAYTTDGYRILGPANWVTIGDPRNQNELGGDATNTNPRMRNTEAAKYINNLTRSIEAFNSPTGAPTDFAPGEFMASQYILVSAADYVPSRTSPTSYILNTARVQLSQDYTLGASVLTDAGYSTFGTYTLNGKVPTRTTLANTYSDKVLVPGGGSYINQGGATVAYNGNLTSRNRIAGDFNGDGKRDLNDATEMLKAYRSRNGGSPWTAPSGTGAIAGAPGTDAIIEVLGDFNADGNFDAADIRYWADGLAIDPATGKLDRKKGYEAIDNAWNALTGNNNFFGTTKASGPAYVAGESRFDIVSGTNPNTPGFTPKADGVIDSNDRAYIAAQIAGGDVDWANDLSKAVGADLSADVTGDLKINGDDLAAIKTALGVCDADFNNDGFLDFTDFDAFVEAFEAGEASSDFNGDGFIDFTDFDAFVAAFELGC